MQETCDNCFGSKNIARSFFRRKHISVLVLTCLPEEGSCYVFRPETIVASFLHSMVLLPKMLFNQACQMSSIFVSFKELYFQTHYVPDILWLQKSQIQKKVLTSDLSRLFTIYWNINSQFLYRGLQLPSLNPQF